MDQNLEKNILRRWVSLCYFKVELCCRAYFNSLRFLVKYHVSSKNCSPPSTAAPTSWAKISNKRPSRVSAPIPSLLTFLNSRDTRKACFYCHFIYDLLRFNYNEHTHTSESKVYNGTTVCEITNHYFNKRKPLILTLRSDLDNDVVFTFLLTI